MIDEVAIDIGPVELEMKTDLSEAVNLHSWEYVPREFCIDSSFHQRRRD